MAVTIVPGPANIGMAKGDIAISSSITTFFKCFISCLSRPEIWLQVKIQFMLLIYKPYEMITVVFF